MIRNDQLVFDVGLHKGEDTEFYLKKGFLVVAFEANPSLVELCRSRFSEEIRSGQLDIVEGAIAPPTATGKITFYVNQHRTIWGTTDIDWVRRNDKSGSESMAIEVDRVDMGEAFRRFGIPFYLKIDIEGADTHVLSALRDFSDRPQFISIEANTVTRDLIEHDMTTLSELGYKKFQLVPQRTIRGSAIYTETIAGGRMEHIFPNDASGPFGDDLHGAWVDQEAIVSALAPQCDSWQDIHAALSAGPIMNVAIGRPATQSSVSIWSTDKDPELDARVANNGDLESGKCFHTEFEADPWWQVDLEGVFIVEKIVIYNRVEARDRLKRFTILRSLDARDWFNVFCKADDNTFNQVNVVVTNPRLARYIRVRLDGKGCLHFRECQIFARHPSPYEQERFRAEDAIFLHNRAQLPAGRKGYIAQVGGFKIFVDEEKYGQNVRSALDQGSYEGKERELALKFLRRGDKVLEVGTAVGAVSMTAAKIVGAKNVSTFDANPDIVADARDNFLRNDLGEIKSYVAVLACRKNFIEGKSAVFHIAREFWASRLHIGSNSSDILRSIEVPIKCLELEMAIHEANVLICDIEGGEIELLSGADLSNIRLIIIETHYWAVGEVATDKLIRELILQGFYLHLGASANNVSVLRRLP